MRTLIVLCLLLSSLRSNAQDTIRKLPAGDLKVGLVLSGGGAKGFAHVGVLKVLEETGVRVDYIAGTSMGAIVGGLYAAGYNARELDSIIRDTNFTTLIQDLIPREAKTFYEKEETDRYAITLPFDKFKLGFPGGISRGQNVYNLLARLTQHVSTIEDFSQLPIPFLCIATDIETGEEVVLDTGSLAKSIAASGALPSLFSPKLIDGKLLIDGGVVNNFPLDKIKSKVDIIIGVDVQDSLKSKEKINSMIDVLSQISSLTTRRGMDAKMAEIDIYLHPDISTYSVVSFDKTPEIITAGELVAENKRALFKQLGSQQKPSERTMPKIVHKDSITVNSINVEGNTKYTRSYVLGKLKLKTGIKVSLNDFDLGVYNLLATRNFTNIDYDFREVEGSDADNEAFDVNFILRESPNTQFLRLSAHYDDVYKTSALLNFTKKRVMTNNDILSFDFIVGDNLRYKFDYYIDKGQYWSIGLSSQYNTTEVNANIGLFGPEFDEIGETPSLNKLAVTHQVWQNRIYTETLFQRNFLLGIGAQHRYLRVFSDTFGLDDKNAKTIFDSSSYYSAIGYLLFDTFTDSYYPTSGVYLRGDIEQLLHNSGKQHNESNSSFSVIKGVAAFALPLKKKLTYIQRLEAGLTAGRQSSKSLDFLLGGYGYRPSHNMVELIGYAPFSIRGDSYISFKATLDYEIFPKNHINFSFNMANAGEDIFKTNAWNRKIEYTGLAVGYGLDSFIGPIEVKYAYSPDLRRSEFYVVVGVPF